MQQECTWSACPKHRGVIFYCLPNVDMSFRSEVDLAAQNPLPPIPPRQLAHLAVLQVAITLLDL